MSNRSQISIPQLLAVMLVLVGAVVAGVFVRNIVRTRQSISEPVEPPESTVVARNEPVGTVPQPVRGTRQRYEPTAPAEEPFYEIPEQPEEPVPTRDNQPVNMQPQEPEEVSFEQGDSKEILKGAFENLDLDPEEGARLGEAVKQVLERYKNLSDTDRLDEMMHLRQQRQQWDQMDESQRRRFALDLRDEFEGWRRSGSVELPESITAVLVIQLGQFAGGEIPKYFEE